MDRSDSSLTGWNQASAAAVVVLGGGVAGLAAARQLARRGRAVVVVEREAALGGLAAGVSFAGGSADLGSHRIHPGYFPEALELLRDLLGEELLRRPRRGRLRLNGSYIDYPPSLLGFLSALGARESLRCALSMLAARTSSNRGIDTDTFEGHLLPRVGRRAYDLFYAPYARKLYGLEPVEVDARAAKLRVTTGKPLTAAREALRRSLGGNHRNGAAFFYYPARGFGSIVEKLGSDAAACGARLLTGAAARRIECHAGRVAAVTLDVGGKEETLCPSAVVSTIPLGALTRLLAPAPPPEVAEAVARLRWRGIRLVQVQLDRERCLEGETYYFPESRYVFGRISEPRQFSPDLLPAESGTILNIEVICSPGESLWALSDDDLLARVLADAEPLGLFRRAEVLASRSLRLPCVYPVYSRRYRDDRDRVLAWVESTENLYSIGRGGLFVHANTDHSLFMGLRAADHLSRPGATAAGWRRQIDDQAFVVRD